MSFDLQPFKFHLPTHLHLLSFNLHLLKLNLLALQLYLLMLHLKPLIAFGVVQRARAGRHVI